MRARELTVTNFRGFAGERTFPLSDGFTVIAGVNGRGKTAVLDALALVISRLFRSLALSAGNQRTITGSDVHGSCDSANLRLKANCAGSPIDFTVNFRPDTTNVVATRLNAAVKRQIIQNYGDPTRADDQAPIAIYYTTDRAGLRLPRTLPSTLPTGQQLAHVGALSNHMVDYRDLMARLRVWKAQGSAELTAFASAMGVFLEGFSDLEVETNPLRLTVRKENQRVSISQLSDGERSLIAMLGDMIRRLGLANPELADPLKGHGVVLIDELELHLHPKWQREIVDKLRATFPNIQFIGTTHSPFVIQSLRPGELVNLDPEDAEYSDRSIEDIAEEIMGVDTPQKGTRFLRMYDAAREYFRLLDIAENEVDLARLRQIKDRLEALSMPFSRDPAYQAFLSFRRELVFREEEQE
jgi:predicted ATP-binding protein involved in virulence